MYTITVKEDGKTGTWKNAQPENIDPVSTCLGEGEPDVTHNVKLHGGTIEISGNTGYWNDATKSINFQGIGSDWTALIPAGPQNTAKSDDATKKAPWLRANKK